MLSPEHSRRALRLLFRQRRIADLPLLLRTLQTDWSMNVFRRMRPLGYVTSYNHAGRYYTLDGVPDFDEDGLWRYQGVFFSKHGTLKATTAHLVEAGEAGRTHMELVDIVRVRVHNTLLELVKAKRIGRELFRGVFLYVSGDSARAAVQVARREQLRSSAPRRVGEAGQPLVIEILLEVIRGARVVAEPADVAARLQARGIEATVDHVYSVFQQHGLKKTLAPRSPSFRP